MKILLLILLGVGLFAILSFLFKRFQKDIIYVLAIGSAINANIFSSTNYPIVTNDIVFGVDSVLYTLFVFCIFLVWLKFGKKDANSLLFSSVCSIIIGAVIELVSNLSSNGFKNEFLNQFLLYLFSVVATFVAIKIMLLFLEKLKNKNKFVLCFLSVLIASFIDSLIYFSLGAILSSLSGDFVLLLAGSYIGKLFAICLCLICLLIIEKLEKTKTQNEKKC